jgi:hypothetical protein
MCLTASLGSTAPKEIMAGTETKIEAETVAKTGTMEFSLQTETGKEKGTSTQKRTEAEEEAEAEMGRITETVTETETVIGTTLETRWRILAVAICSASQAHASGIGGVC